MKKFLLIAMVACIAIPALAVDISLVDNTDGTGTIQYTVASGEIVRGLAIIVNAGEGSVIAVTDVNPEFNVFMDAAWYEENTAGSQYGVSDGYEIAEGSPIADPCDAGPIALPQSQISLCMGVLDEEGGQAGATDDGTYDVATIDLGEAGTVTITQDGLRGGIVGTDLGVIALAGGPITKVAVTTYTLTITVDGTGTGTVDAPYVAGAQQVDEGTIVTVAGTPAAGSALTSIVPNGFEMIADAAVTVTFDLDAPLECMMDTHPDYTRWAAIGKPDCWCYVNQHAGDINGVALYGYYPVSNEDLAIFVGAFMDPAGDICADLNHVALYGYYPVSNEDLAIFVPNFMTPTVSANPNVAHYNFYITP